jgi:hypothetical protein
LTGNGAVSAGLLLVAAAAKSDRAQRRPPDHRTVTIGVVDRRFHHASTPPSVHGFNTTSESHSGGSGNSNIATIERASNDDPASARKPNDQ